MTGSPHRFPPPGAPQPEEPATPGSAVPGAPAWGAPAEPPSRPVVPGMLGAAHKPGAVPLRPLTLGNIYDGAFRIIRFNAAATVGAAVLVTAVAMTIPIVVNLVLAFTVGSGLEAGGELDEEASTAEVLGLLGGFGSLIIGTYAAQLGIIFVIGMIAHVTRAAAVGRRLSLAEAWAATYGKRWRLLGQTLLVGLASLIAIVAMVAAVVLVAVVTGDVLITVLVALLAVAALVPLYAWLWIKTVYLATPALMLEPIGVFESFRRNWHLTAGGFWRILGIGLLTVVITSFAGSILSTPFSVAGQVGGVVLPEYFFLLYSLGIALGTIVQNAFVAPFTAAVTSLQYLDQRMRKEAYDVELMAEAGLIRR